MDKFELFKDWVNGKLPHQSGSGRDHHAADAIQRFEMWLANSQQWAQDWKEKHDDPA